MICKVSSFCGSGRLTILCGNIKSIPISNLQSGTGSKGTIWYGTNSGGLPFNSKNPGHGSYIQGGCVTYHNQGGGPYTVLLQNNLNRLIVYKANGQRQTLDQFSYEHLRLMATYKVG